VGDVRQVVLLLSGEAGWNSEMKQLAQLLGKLCTANRAAPDQGRCSNSRHEEKPNLIAGMELWRDSPRFSLVFDFTRDTDARAAAIVV
jgi:hypothetical protein